MYLSTLFFGSKSKIAETCNHGLSCRRYVELFSTMGFQRENEGEKSRQMMKTVTIYWRTRPGAAIHCDVRQGWEATVSSFFRGCRFSLFIHSPDSGQCDSWTPNMSPKLATSHWLPGYTASPVRSWCPQSNITFQFSRCSPSFCWKPVCPKCTTPLS